MQFGKKIISKFGENIMLEHIKKYTRPNSDWFPYQHLFFLASLVYAITLDVAWYWWVSAFVMWFMIISLGINFTYHRLLSHKSFKTYTLVEYFFSFLGMLANTGSPLAWVMMHRQHHRHTDNELDPHSPHNHGLKILFSLYDDTLYKERPSDALMYARHLFKKKFHVFIHDWYHAIIIAYYLALFLIGGINALLFLGFVPAILGTISTNLSNYFNHYNGYRNFPTNDDSRNTWWLIFFAFGENWHNNHHYDPANPTFGGVKWWEIDPTGFFVNLLRTDDKPVRKTAMRKGDEIKSLKWTPTE
jgi:stearoyl-CoA desaturase (delta-9 desaturase)